MWSCSHGKSWTTWIRLNLHLDYKKTKASDLKSEAFVLSSKQLDLITKIFKTFNRYQLRIRSCVAVPNLATNVLSEHLLNQLSIKIPHFHSDSSYLLGNQTGFCLARNSVYLDEVKFPSFNLKEVIYTDCSFAV